MVAVVAVVAVVAQVAEVAEVAQVAEEGVARAAYLCGAVRRRSLVTGTGR